MTSFYRNVVTCLALLTSASAFLAPGASSAAVVRASTLDPLFAYVPDGMTAEQWADLQKKEKTAASANGRNLGRLGARGFKSRSFKAFHEAMENGEAGHNFALFDAEGKVARGEIKREDIPYMQRAGGSWDDSDVKSAKKKKWTSYDKFYAAGGYKKELSAGIFGGTQHEAWQKAWGVNNNKGNEVSNDIEMWKAAGATFGKQPEKKGFAGMFGLNRERKVANINDLQSKSLKPQGRAGRGAMFGKSAPAAPQAPVTEKKAFWQR